MSASCLACILLILQRRPQGISVSRGQEKPGSCPPLSMFALGKCGIGCGSDGECAGNLKCCKTGCDGTQCQVPDDKPGSCPRVKRDQPCDRRIRCRTDRYCDADLKCCRTKCGGSSCLVAGGNRLM